MNRLMHHFVTCLYLRERDYRDGGENGGPSRI